MIFNQIQPTNTINPNSTGTYGNTVPKVTTTVEAESAKIPADQKISINKDLNTYNQFIDEIQTVSRLVVSDEFQKYSKTSIMNRSVLQSILEQHEIFNNYIEEDWLFNIFKDNQIDLEAFLDTAFEYELINITKINIVKNDPITITSMFSASEITYILNKQQNFNVYIPSKDDLVNFSNIEVLLRDIVKVDPSALFDTEYIKNLISEILVEKFRENHFLSSEKMTQLYTTPIEFFTILSDIEIKDLLQRVNPYLEFVSEEFENNVILYSLDNNILNEDIISVNEIKLILDTEVELKNKIISLFNYEDISGIFGTFKEELFKNEFKDLIQEAVNYNLFSEISEEQTQDWINTTIQDNIDSSINPIT